MTKDAGGLSMLSTTIVAEDNKHALSLELSASIYRSSHILPNETPPNLSVASFRVTETVTFLWVGAIVFPAPLRFFDSRFGLNTATRAPVHWKTQVQEADQQQ